MFRLTLNNEVDQRIRRMVKIPNLTSSAHQFWSAMANLQEQIAANPVEIGEAKYDYKHVKLRSYQVVRSFIAFQYAVSEEHAFVFVEKITLCGNHPYPPQYEEILNQKTT